MCLQRHKNMLISSHTHSLSLTHTTNTCFTGDELVEWEERRRRITMQKRRGGFSVLTPDSEDKHLTERVTEFQITGQICWKGLFPRVLPRNTEYLMLSEESKKESRDEAAQRGIEELYQRQCGSRWELLYTESRYWLVASGYCRVKEWCGQI